MKKTLITALLLGTGLITAGCEKTYSVAELKKDPKLMEEWIAKCGFAGTSKNCENLRLAQLELEKEYEAQEAERIRKAEEHNKKIWEKARAEMRARLEKMDAETKRLRAEQEAKERAAEEREAKERAKQQQDNH
ncbi:EexN family lipoprotein [Bartonella machadoae]|uniref:EexN family lipoprotein n=1 Tax=Bartonella machadoae TaxID=2893471 RepID=UPI001F4CCB85|nr:EexN family lipoprotein [Bartonella machadoae]UNE53879.1 EexN family lipoprotein [Bartonella machadoae]